MQRSLTNQPITLPVTTSIDETWHNCISVTIAAMLQLDPLLRPSARILLEIFSSYHELSVREARNVGVFVSKIEDSEQAASNLLTRPKDLLFQVTDSPTQPANIYCRSDSLVMLQHLPCLHTTPRPHYDDLIPFFLSYHQQNINYGRYFWHCDHYRFIKEGLLDLAKQSFSLQYAIAAFSALIYSIQVGQHTKKFAFFFYGKAIQELQQIINTYSMDSEASVHTTVATILELASVEVRPCNKSLIIASDC